jgi:hypothetical protein
MMRTSRRYVLTQGAAASVVVLIMLLSTFFFFLGGSVFSRTVTIAASTVSTTETTTVFGATSTFTVTWTYTTTAWSLNTITYEGPSTVTVSGSASTRQTGLTSPYAVMFVDAQTGANYTAKLAPGNTYSIALPNHASYNVFLLYNTIAAGLVGGRCLAGALVLSSVSNTLLADWSC